MEQHRDEHIVCANCGASFLFSAGEAAVFAERSLAAPKRCKECRRARKEQGGSAPQGRPAPAWGGGSGNQGGGGAPQGGFAQRGRPAPRYTGDVNEYRSPMQDNSYGNRPAWGGGNNGGGNQGGGNGYAPRGPRPPMGGRPSFGGASPGGARGPSRGGPPPWQQQGGGDGNYRAPSFHGNNGGGYEARDNRFAGPPRGAPQDSGFAAGPPGGDSAQMQRRRPTAEMFSITCNSCGVHAEVPFRPAEGRDVFCQACYRARKPT